MPQRLNESPIYLLQFSIGKLTSLVWQDYSLTCIFSPRIFYATKNNLSPYPILMIQDIPNEKISLDAKWQGSWKIAKLDCMKTTQFFQAHAHCRNLSKIRTHFSMSQKSKSMLEFQAHICWVITVNYKVRLGQVKSEFD